MSVEQDDGFRAVEIPDVRCGGPVGGLGLCIRGLAHHTGTAWRGGGVVTYDEYMIVYYRIMGGGPVYSQNNSCVYYIFIVFFIDIQAHKGKKRQIII